MASVLPYQFEPESDPESDNGADGANDERDVSRRLDQDVSLWCTCGNCATMPSEVENVCCREITKVVRRMSQVPIPIMCMTEHPGLEPVCLNPYSLQNIYNIYKYDYGPVRHRTEEERLRHLAYRSFVSWCWGYLGPSRRVIIPSCVVQRIRQQFPSGDYIGFRPPID
ncbi:P2X purinoceptor 7-like isoform X1 [Alosa sapidissima]|uniref:P2X purinoceptor 7-like isoform X1 n=1 Tax=Alosa sapidissima TaxID=34773 RepID=UPI001C099F20|nr:P2X purinoceptor 7-like isoform X1 [Alosa sapidissima]XP_041926888.1 P2X purinoceptor 7-like isoform X1 [Alosa sapidissima]XP_041929954.1 P2X purinoceptor 7-like isoform X1 [Alosa sapidissima]XP_041939118.1 P2X purinoceptor 7-like isoform X1 [Alosa sapidissima]XP_041943582.1 P2X purinoceptor 7-like isoform X1 [Alosa sapidissima]XP_041948393.1 P2X purinoceptor 7-like isoform X1 [Alosa sapidissima]XP_041949993.1 P2X purinoceptor 7-like isoform X1 [Alosa sapidissima]